MKCKTCGFNNELHNMQFCGLNCAEKGYFKQAEQIEQYVKISYMSRVEIAKLKTELDASQSSHKALETLYLQVRDEELAEAKAELAELKAQHQKQLDTLYSAKMVYKDREIQRLKDVLSISLSELENRTMGIDLKMMEKRFKQALAAQPQKGGSDENNT